MRRTKKLAKRDRIVFDAAGLSNVDATFLRFLLRLRAYSGETQSGRLQLIGVTDELRHVLEETGLCCAFAWESEAS